MTRLDGARWPRQLPFFSGLGVSLLVIVLQQFCSNAQEANGDLGPSGAFRIFFRASHEPAPDAFPLQRGLHGELEDCPVPIVNVYAPNQLALGINGDAIEAAFNVVSY